MPNAKMTKIKWLPDAEDHDYPAVESCLGLVDGPDQVRAIIARLKTAPATQFKAKDIFRASQLSLLG